MEFVNGMLFGTLSEKYEIFKYIFLTSEYSKKIGTKIAGELYIDPDFKTQVSENVKTETKSGTTSTFSSKRPDMAIVYKYRDDMNKWKNEIVAYIEFKKFNAMVELCFCEARANIGSKL